MYLFCYNTRLGIVRFTTKRYPKCQINRILKPQNGFIYFDILQNNPLDSTNLS